MALVAAVAVGLAVPDGFRNFSTVRRDVNVSFQDGENSTSSLGVGASDYMNRLTAASFRPPIKGEIIYWARQFYFWPGPCMAGLSLATLGFGIAHGRRLARRPGMAMATAVCAAMIVAAVRLPHLLGVGPGPLQLHWREWWLEFWFTVPRLAGFAVAVSWLTLALGGRWRVGGRWQDRLGVCLGAGWISMATIDLAATWYYALPF
jgi:hypothetical protein